MKAERVTEGRHITDMLDGQKFVDGQKYMVTFPDGTRKKLTAVILQQVLVQAGGPAIVMREQAFFPVRHCGLPEVWVRAIDLPDIQVIDDKTPEEIPVVTPLRSKKSKKA